MAAAPKTGWGVLWLLPVVIVPVAVFAGLPWLRTLAPSAAIWITAATVVLVTGYANYLAFRAQRGLDEVRKAAGSFAAQWGAPAGQAVFVLLLLSPPFKDAMTAAVGRFAPGVGATVDGTVVLVSLALGFCAIVLLQAVGAVVVQAVWWAVKR